MDSRKEREIQDEINDLLGKKERYGWTAKDAERYYFLKKLLGED